MTPKEKSEQIVNNYKLILIMSDTDAGEEILCTLIAKQCAVIAVDEIMKAGSDVDEYAECYWQEVKKEIENL